MLAIRGHGAARSLAALAACLLTGCGYKPSSFSFHSQPVRGASATVGCIDLAITPHPEVLPDRSTVLAYEFGNRCDRPTVIDLSTAPVVGRAADGRMYSLAAYDPAREIRPAMLDGRDHGRELIAYPADVDLIDVCVDAAALVHQAPPQWLCVFTRAPSRDNHIAKQGGS